MYVLLQTAFNIHQRLLVWADHGVLSFLMVAYLAELLRTVAQQVPLLHLAKIIASKDINIVAIDQTSSRWSFSNNYSRNVFYDTNKRQS